MNEKIDFKAFKQEAEVQQFLESQLSIGTATPIDVFSFLGDQDLRHSGYIDNSPYANSAAPLPFEYRISAVAPKKRVGLLFPARWHILFYFEQHKLAQIEVTHSADGI